MFWVLHASGSYVHHVCPAPCHIQLAQQLYRLLATHSRHRLLRMLQHLHQLAALQQPGANRDVQSHGDPGPGRRSGWQHTFQGDSQRVHASCSCQRLAHHLPRSGAHICHFGGGEG